MTNLKWFVLARDRVNRKLIGIKNFFIFLTDIKRHENSGEFLWE